MFFLSLKLSNSFTLELEWNLDSISWPAKCTWLRYCLSLSLPVPACVHMRVLPRTDKGLQAGGHRCLWSAALGERDDFQEDVGGQWQWLWHQKGTGEGICLLREVRKVFSEKVMVMGLWSEKILWVNYVKEEWQSHPVQRDQHVQSPCEEGVARPWATER